MLITFVYTVVGETGETFKETQLFIILDVLNNHCWIFSKTSKTSEVTIVCLPRTRLKSLTQGCALGRQCVIVFPLLQIPPASPRTAGNLRSGCNEAFLAFQWTVEWVQVGKSFSKLHALIKRYIKMCTKSNWTVIG